MADPFLGEIRMVGFNFAPQGWAFCDGQLLPIGQNSALFSLLGTTYGGDGASAFALPDMRGRFPTHHGTGPGLTPVAFGQQGGAETRTLGIVNLPAHNHSVTLRSVDDDASTGNAAGNALANAGNAVFAGDSPDTNMAAGSISQNDVGGGQSFSIMNPYQAVSFCIALVGVFPSEN